MSLKRKLILFVMWAVSLPLLGEQQEKRINEIQKRITKLERKYLRLEGRKTFSRSGIVRLDRRSHFYTDMSQTASRTQLSTHFNLQENKFRVDKQISVENCFVGVAVEVFNAEGKSVLKEEGPINLRQVTDLQRVEFNPGESVAYKISFDTQKNDFPELYYRSERQREKAYKILDEMRYLCRIRYMIKKSTESGVQNDAKPLEVMEGNEEFDRPVRHFAEDPGMRGALLTNGEEAWVGRMQTAQHATKPGDSLYLQTLIYMADEAGLYWSNELVEKRRRGVDVQVYIDALSPFLDVRDLTVRDNTRKMYHNMMAAGIPVYGYRCKGHRLIDEIKFSKSYDTKTYDQRPHEKIWLVNDSHVIVGGMNIGNDYFRLNRKGFSYWRDQDVLLEGKEIVQDFKNIFVSNADSYKGNFLDPHEDSCYNPYDPINESTSYERFYMKHRLEYRTKRTRFFRQDIQAHARTKIKEFERKAMDPKALYYQTLKAARAVHNRPKLKELSIEKAYIEMLDRAQEEVLIANSYFIPSLEVRQAVRRAAKRGVRVAILTNSYATNDVPPVAVLGRHTYKELVDFNFGPSLENGREVEIYEWVGDDNDDGVLEQGTNHAKFIIADRKIAFIGSYNLDPRSRDINSEVGVMLESGGGKGNLAARLSDEFWKVDLRFSKRVSYSQMISFRRPVTVLKATWLRLNGGFHTLDIGDVFKNRFFYHIAHYNEDTW